ncbi:putative serine esterase-domain-containing protein [Multifurca ochricompacta]|uniref:Serine esterase-domain-containing protein n=1 Tax=Multifurca ochricompacta TaxID=376703 RepID=A0AAD4LYD5_9AGAM|nr:putative serine esterase-domain-containing protein [Multifurca ochricompacta]
MSVHLLVLIHGMWGNPSNLASMRRIIEETHLTDGSELHVMLPETNQAEGTYDGIDWGGERVATEIFQEIEKLEAEGKKVTRFSVTGYSLGGLLARYVVGILHQRKFFATVTPVNFNTVATPHIGLLVYPSIFSRLSSYLVPRFFSRTGEQFYGADKWSQTGKSLLEVMADPGKELGLRHTNVGQVFYQGLKLFPHVRLYANAVNDLTVPYMTAYVDVEDPFINHVTEGITVDYDDKYYPIVKSFTSQGTPSLKRESARPFTWDWFKSYKLPYLPGLYAPFPFNFAALALIPILFPTLICLMLIRVSISSYFSRSRIKLLESEDTPTTQQRLVHVFGQLERDRKRAGPEEEPADHPNPEKNGVGLNALPQLKKELAYITDVRNSHGAIVARDVKNFGFHKIGEGVLRHWANAFVM